MERSKAIETLSEFRNQLFIGMQGSGLIDWRTLYDAVCAGIDALGGIFEDEDEEVEKQ